MTSAPEIERQMSQIESSASNDITPKERAGMVLCPCIHITNQRLFTTDCCACCHEDKEVLNIPPLIEAAGTWISPQNPVNLWFLVVRLILTVFVIYCALFTFILYALDGHAWAYFMYLTQWTAICTMVLMILNISATFTVYFMNSKEASYSVSESNEFSIMLYKKVTLDPTSRIFRIYVIQKIFLQMMVPFNLLVVFQFWLLVFKPSTFNGYPVEWKASNIQLHGATFVALFIDFLISGQRLYYKSPVWAIVFGTIFTFWTIIFEVFIGENENGIPYLYSVFDWSAGITLPLIVYISSFGAMTGIVALCAFIKKLILMYCSKLHQEKIKHHQDQSTKQTELTI